MLPLVAFNLFIIENLRPFRPCPRAKVLSLGPGSAVKGPDRPPAPATFAQSRLPSLRKNGVRQGPRAKEDKNCRELAPTHAPVQERFRCEAQPPMQLIAPMSWITSHQPPCPLRVVRQRVGNFALTSKFHTLWTTGRPRLAEIAAGSWEKG